MEFSDFSKDFLFTRCFSFCFPTMLLMYRYEHKTVCFMLYHYCCNFDFFCNFDNLFDFFVCVLKVVTE